MIGLRIRRALAGDASTLTDIAHASKAHWGYTQDLLGLWRADLTVSADFIEKHPVWAAIINGEIVGFYALSGCGAVSELEHLWVEPRWMGLGVGRALFEHALAQARAAGAKELRVVSDPNAEGFYVRRGARRVGECDSVPPGRRLPVLVVSLEPAASL